MNEYKTTGLFALFLFFLLFVGLCSRIAYEHGKEVGKLEQIARQSCLTDTECEEAFAE